MSETEYRDEYAEELAEGTVVRVTYESTHGNPGNTQEFTAEVVANNVRVVDGVSLGTIRLARDPEDITRRRIDVTGGCGYDLEGRRTTINGAEWGRLNRIATNVTVEVVEEPEEAEGEAEAETDGGTARPDGGIDHNEVRRKLIDAVDARAGIDYLFYSATERTSQDQTVVDRSVTICGRDAPTERTMAGEPLATIATVDGLEFAVFEGQGQDHAPTACDVTTLVETGLCLGEAVEMTAEIVTGSGEAEAEDSEADGTARPDGGQIIRYEIGDRVTDRDGEGAEMVVIDPNAGQCDEVLVGTTGTTVAEYEGNQAYDPADPAVRVVYVAALGDEGIVPEETDVSAIDPEELGIRSYTYPQGRLAPVRPEADEADPSDQDRDRSDERPARTHMTDVRGGGKTPKDRSEPATGATEDCPECDGTVAYGPTEANEGLRAWVCLSCEGVFTTHVVVDDAGEGIRQ